MEVGFALSPRRCLALNGGDPWYGLAISPLVLIMFSSVGEVPGPRSNAVNCQPSSSLAARVEDWFSVASCYGSSFMCGG
ncbi:hypothetical protein Bca4012_036905 [Brassica carinata]